MNALPGMEKFSHLEDKIYLTVEYLKKMREEKERLEREVGDVRRDAEAAIADRDRTEEKLAALLDERENIQRRVEAMLDALAALDTEVAHAVQG